jgi:RND superfamily putative drug exporter
MPSKRDGAACGDAGRIGGGRGRGSSLPDGGGLVATVGGLNVHVTGPGSTIADEFSTINRHMLGITAATVVLIFVLMLLGTGHRLSQPVR